MKLSETIKKNACVAGRYLNKKAPSIMTAAGIAGMGATVYYTYKSKDNVEEVVKKLEEDRENGVEPNKIEVARDLSQALALPISLGLTSVGLILMAQQIQNKRIKALASTVAMSAAESTYYRAKFKDQYGEKEYDEFFTPINEQKAKVKDEDGKETNKKVKVRDDIGIDLSGVWFDKSSEYAADDHSYNKIYVDQIIERLELIYFQRGFLLMNEVLQEFGLPTTRKGAVLGWSMSGSDPKFKAVTHLIYNESTGFEEPQIFIQWNHPESEYETFDYAEGLDKWR